ncbi:EAL domain-containing protein [Pseudomonas sp. GD04158]|uniref:EAL domain-containing protein n=1 Tax=Pseudomonas sp. GD04158 TaxID=2975439 RepID=UPI00244CE74C|nr:EAL domain-containing protein [Pseudomonas sp. GD04158]MDH0098849.1 EAL domain-containing protein [Pseudomonas sp. GD04158]
MASLPRLAGSSKRLLMLLVLLLVALFLTAMWVMSTLNLDYSQRAMAELRRSQIEDNFYANLGRINSHHRRMELHTESLARLGELLQRSGNTAELETQLRQKLRDFSDAFGVGLWFEPGHFPALADTPGIYAHWAADRRIEVLRQSGDPRRLDWYRNLLPSDQPRNLPLAEPLLWSAAYYNPLSDAAVITLATPLYDRRQRIIGLASSDWRSEDVVRLISDIKLTPNTFSFLLDRDNRKLTSLSERDDTPAAQRIMDAILAEQLTRAATTTGAPGTARAQLYSRELLIDGERYALLFAMTRANMLFGLGVPQNEIDAVLAPMRQSNLRILVLTGLVVLLLAALLLHLIANTMRQLEASYTDPLTQLPNRARLLLDLQRTPRPSLILLNLDAFKEINGFYGHACGDQMLRHLGAQLLQHLRLEADSARLYRLTADEFAVLLPRLSDEALEARMNELGTFIQRQRLDWQGQEVGFNATFGAARLSAGEARQGRDSLLASATIALKLARLQQRNHLLYDPALKIREEYEQNLLWANKVKTALQGDRLLPHFQPILDNHGGSIGKFECLVRMLDDDGQVINPGRFLGVAKKIRLHRQITRVMLEKCLERFRDLPYEFSINLSYEDLIDPQLSQTIKEQLQHSGMGPRLIFEILESEGIDNYSQVRAFIDEVKALGCRIAIDDFGTGYSNFEHLLRLNVDLIKIDGSLIRQLDSDPNALAVTLGIVQFARSLGMQTVAEFVHSAAVQEKVLALGIDYSQGQHIGMPQAQLQTQPPP